MADKIDEANEYAASAVEQALAGREQYHGESASHCIECDAEIPVMRQRMLPGVQYCVDCAEVRERHAQHYN